MTDPMDYIAPHRRTEPGAEAFAAALARTLRYPPDFLGPGVWLWKEPIPPTDDMEAAARRLNDELARFI
jgi:hypothetical protein